MQYLPPLPHHQTDPVLLLPPACWDYRNPEKKNRKKSRFEAQAYTCGAYLLQTLETISAERAAEATAAATAHQAQRNVDIAAPSAAQASSSAASSYMEHIAEMFTIKSIPADGDCCFGAFAAIASDFTGQQISSKDMRLLLGNHIVQIEGLIKIHDKDGCFIGCNAYNALDPISLEPIPSTIQFEIMRGNPVVTLSVAEFKQALIKGHKKSKIYGGDECFAAFVDLYQISIARHSVHVAEPEIFNIARPFTHADYHFLYKQGKHPAEDHYDILVPKHAASAEAAPPPAASPPSPQLSLSDATYYAKYHDFISRIQEGQGFEVFDFGGELGRGLRSLRFYRKGDPIGWYGGARVDRHGRLRYFSPDLRALYKRFPEIDRERQKTAFQASHAVRMCREYGTS